LNKLNQNWRIIFTLASVALVLFLLWYFRTIISYVILAVIIAFIGDPLMDQLKKFRIKNFVLPPWLRALITLLCIIGLFLGLGALFAPLVADEIEFISSIDPEIVSNAIQEQISNLAANHPVIQDNLSNIDFSTLVVTKIQSIFSFQWLQSIFGGVFGFVGNLVIGLFAVLFIAFFFLKDGFLFARITFTLTPEKHIEKMKNIIEHTHILLRRYFIGIALQSLIMALMVGLSLYFLGIKNAVLIGLFAGIVNVIPYVGPLMGAGFALLIALTSSMQVDFVTSFMPIIAKVLGVFIIAQQIDGFVVQPMVLGNSVKAHPLEIFIVVLAAGTIGGVVGMVMAIPVYTILRVVAKEFLSEFKAVDSLTRDLTD
jgi:predicted PurR-regulated permease PerM